MGAQEAGRASGATGYLLIEEGKELVSKRSSQDKTEGAMDKVTGRAKEATGSLTGNKDKKAEGRADQDKGTLKKKKGAVKDLLK
jgi:uncharacterized protein YjbJ (UPF0337 family)